MLYEVITRVTDTEGKVYLDALSGIAVNTLGHNHPVYAGNVVKAMASAKDGYPRNNFV